jgi:general L-amino acid transport system permease protein
MTKNPPAKPCVRASAIAKFTPLVWLQKNLFNTWYNTLLTLVCVWLLFQGAQSLVVWAFTQAKWAVITVNLPLFLFGRFPQSEYWRGWLALGLIIGLVGASWYGISSKHKFTRFLPGTWGVIFLILLWLIGGGLGLSVVESSYWNGLLLTLLMAGISIVLSFPLGVLLALGRQSTLPVFRWLSIFYIEVVRGLPLIGILFLAQVMLPLFLPVEIRLDAILRAIAGLVLFSAAYMAENVRGGLQTIPRGQVEAARSLGLNTFSTLILIVLPQALRAVIPAIVGQFIGLFKDTSLLSLFALVELTGMAKSIVAQPLFLGRYAEVYLFIGLIYWGFCYSMSLFSRQLEKQLNTGNK